MYDSKAKIIQNHLRCVTASVALETRPRYCQSNLLVVPNVLRGRSKEILNELTDNMSKPRQHVNVAVNMKCEK